MDRSEKRLIMSGKVIWITGLSASGKTTIATELQKLLAEKDLLSIILDGDQVREAIADYNCGHDHLSRIQNAYRISRFANLISRQGVIVIVATMSLYHEIHKWNRKNLSDYFEVFLKADIETLKRRDPKGIYSNLSQGNIENLPGMDLTPEFPVNPDLELINNCDLKDVRPIAEMILEKTL